MTNVVDTRILCNTLEGTPFDWNIVLNVGSLGEDGIITRAAAALEFLRRIIVDAV
jgi:hypothetical protein